MTPTRISDRGGSDTPLDGELGLSATNTVISRFRRLVASELTLNDNDNPAALDIGAYFNAGGDGNDLTIYLQTLDGEVSFTAAAQYILGGPGFARFTLPADAQTLLNNLSTGDRWIFKAARLAATDTITANADPTAFSISNPEATGVTAPASATTTQTILLDVPVYIDDFQAFLSPLPYPVLDPAFTEGASELVEVVIVRLYADGRVNLSLDSGTDSLLESLEGKEDVFRFQSAGLTDLVVDGPSNVDNVSSDTQNLTPGPG